MLNKRYSLKRNQCNIIIRLCNCDEIMAVQDKEFITNCFVQQIGEFELLKSMYPDPGEIVLSDKHSIDEINSFIENRSEYIPSFLDFKLNLLVDNMKLEIFINLPKFYPKEEPDIYVSCNKLNRQMESSLNMDLSNYLKENHVGDVCLYTAVSWLQENIDKYTVNTPEVIAVVDEPHTDEDEFARFWIHSHHIYNKKKKDDIINKAKDLKLTGFSLPGKPGIVCIEGHHSSCKEWWRHIKGMNWKKIVIRKTEIFKSDENNTYRKFRNFEELKLNMSDLAKYLNKLGLINIFNELFGFSNDDGVQPLP